MVLLDGSQWLHVLADDCRQKWCEIDGPASGRTGLPLNVRKKWKEIDPELIPKEDVDGTSPSTRSQRRKSF